MNELQHFLNRTRCVTIPNKKTLECNYLLRDNFLSEYVTDEDKLKVLDNLGILEYMENIQNNVNNSLNLFVSLQYLEDNFVKKKDVYYPYDGSGDYHGDDSGSGSPSNPSGNIFINVDNELSLMSTNPVQNKVITRALIKKADLDTLEQYTKFVDLASYLKAYLKELVAGYGITIDKDTNTISTTLDLNPFVVTDELPEGSDINPSKIYIVKRGGYYILYKYTPTGWIELGRDYLSINMNNYYTKTESDTRYMLRTQYSEIEDYVLTYITGLLKLYVKKSDVYTPYYGNEDDPNGGDSPGGWNPGGGGSYNIIVDSTLSAYSDNPVKNRTLFEEFLKKADLSDIQRDYVTKNYLTQTLLDYNLQGKLKTINGQTLIGTGNIQISLECDNELSSLSLNPVQNRVLKLALDSKVDNSTFLTAINSKQNVLTAGYGIDISGNIISVSIDTSPFMIVDELPLIGEISKIYLVKNGQQYDQYIYTNENGWELKGTIDFNIDLSNYLKSSDAYRDFVKISDMPTLLSDYATRDYVLDTFVTKAEANFSTTQQLTELRNYVNLTFVKKKDVYTDSNGDDIDPGGGGNEGGELPSNPTIVGNTYESLISNGTKTNVTVGNILQGTDVSSLKGLTFTQLFDMMLFKEIWPVANYEHSISLGILPTVVKVGSPVVQPSVLAVWNNNILPTNQITYNVIQSVQGDTYENVGTETFTLNYSYPAGTYVITSNYGNTREIEKPAKLGTMTRNVKVTYPWYLNNIEQSVLVPINTDYTFQVALTGSPSIAIPGQYSSCEIQVNLGLGFMDVANWTKTYTLKNGITYSVWTKSDAYLQNVEHKITFNISL